MHLLNVSIKNEWASFAGGKQHSALRETTALGIIRVRGELQPIHP